MTFERIHEVGSKRHPYSWFSANLAAVHAINETGNDPRDEKIQRLVAAVVLRILDVVGKSGSEVGE